MSNEKQIEEMACEKCLHHLACLTNSEYVPTPCPAYEDKAGYRKQSEGENIALYPSSAFECSECHWQDWDLFTADSSYNFCPNCGAKMKGGAE